MRWCVAILLVSAVAHAEPPATPLPFGVVVTAGIGTAGTEEQYEGANYEPITAIQLDAGARIRNWMVGAHVGFNSGTPQTVWHFMSMYDLGWLYTYRPIQIGITGHVAWHHRFYASGWLGVQRGWSREECAMSNDSGSWVTTCTRGDWRFLDGNKPAIGVAFGGDTIEIHGHRLTVMAAFSHAFFGDKDETGVAYTSVWLGVGYRFWDR